MITTNERIKKLRKALDLTQMEFADRIGTTANVLTNYETGRRNPSKSVINNICKEFHVSEEWLRTGEGEMFITISRDEEISAFVDKVLQGESDSFRRRFVAALSRLDDSGWDALEAMVTDIAGGKGPVSADPVDQQAVWEAEARAEAEEVYREILAEKRAAAGLSASPDGTGKQKQPSFTAKTQKSSEEHTSELTTHCPTS